MSRIVNESTIYSLAERAELLRRFEEALDHQATVSLNGAEDEHVDQTVRQLAQQYRENVPLVQLSRNPFTGEILERYIDCFGLDGLWWNYGHSTRPIEFLSPTTVGVTGAVCLSEPIESTEFLIKPGPGKPYIIPRTMTMDGVKAVISHLKIGNHDGYAIAYFAPSPPKVLKGCNDWAIDIARYDLGDDQMGWYEWHVAPSDLDFNLEPYLESGQLLWITPGDESLELKSGLDCPYRSVDGNAFWQAIQVGKVREDILWEAEPEFEEYDAEESLINEPESANAPVAMSEQEIEPKKPKFCRECGASLSTEASFCKQCGAKVKRD